MIKRLLTTGLVLASFGIGYAHTYTVEEQNDSLMQRIAMLEEQVSGMQTKADKEARNIDNRNLWKSQKSIDIAYYNGSMERDEDGQKWDTDLGISFINRKTYFIPSNAIGGFFKVGIDVKWIDASYIRYKDHSAISGTIGQHPTESYNGIPGFTFPSQAHFDKDNGLNFDLGGTQQIDYGMGLGISANFAPFFALNNQLKYLRAAIYGHFTPTVSALIVDESGSDKFHVGFNPMINIGGHITWRILDLGVEYRFGTAKYKSLDEDSFDIDDDDFMGSGSFPSINFDNSKFKMSGWRFYFGFSF